MTHKENEDLNAHQIRTHALMLIELSLHRQGSQTEEVINLAMKQEPKLSANHQIFAAKKVGIDWLEVVNAANHSLLFDSRDQKYLQIGPKGDISGVKAALWLTLKPLRYQMAYAESFPLVYSKETGRYFDLVAGQFFNRIDQIDWVAKSIKGLN